MRLDAVAKDVAERLRAATPEMQRKACLVACQLALQSAPIDAPVVSEALRCLQQQEELDGQKLTDLGELVAQLDEKYLDLQEKAENEPIAQADSLRTFGQARAVAALSYAAAADPLTAATEAIYEASATVDDGRRIFDAVLLALSE